MIEMDKIDIYGWEAALRGMRNPMNSWDRADTEFKDGWPVKSKLGENDAKLAFNLAKAGPVHAKYRRMITLVCDITAPLYWWKEFDTYKVGTVANSCSTMHKLCEKPFSIDDFSHEHLMVDPVSGKECPSNRVFKTLISYMNMLRDRYLETKDKKYWYQIIQLLPTSYNQKRTVQMSYEVLSNIYISRKDHKLDEWRLFCKWLEELPCSYLITCENGPKGTEEPLKEEQKEGKLDEISEFKAEIDKLHLEIQKLEYNNFIRPYPSLWDVPSLYPNIPHNQWFNFGFDNDKRKDQK